MNHLVSDIQSDGLNSIVQEVVNNVPWMILPVNHTAIMKSWTWISNIVMVWVKWSYTHEYQASS